MSDPQWSVAGGGYEAANDLGGDIRSTVGKLLEIDQAVYSQAHETYLHMSAERAAAIRQSAERLERLLVDEAKASGYPLAPFAKLTGRGSATMSRWGNAPLLTSDDDRHSQ